MQDVVECHLKDMILKHFDPKKADSIFTAAEQVIHSLQIDLLLIKGYVICDIKIN